MKAMLRRYRAHLIASSAIILLPMLAGAILWNRLPEQVPIHFNLAGEADNTASRAFAVFALPLFMLAVQWLCILLSANDPKRLNISPKMMRLVLWICPVIGLLASALTYASALGTHIDLRTIMPLFFGLLFVIIGNYLPKCRQNYTMGIKLPWTLHDEENWNRTHRFAGYVWTVGGVLIAAGSLAGLQVALFFVCIALFVALPMIYSYVLFLKKNR